MDKLFEDLKDIILVLKHKDKCKDKNFQEIWNKKCDDVVNRINLLSQSEHEELEEKYQEWFKTGMV